MIYGSWDVNCDRFFVILGHFCPFTYPPTLRHPSPNSPKNKNIKKMKKKTGDIIILQKCTKNHDHRLYCSWDMAHDRCNCYFSSWAIFCPFNPLTAKKIKISKNWKKHPEVSSFYTCVPENMIKWCIVPATWCTTDNRQTDGQMDRQNVTYRGGCPA